MLKNKEMKSMQMSLVNAITNLTNAMNLTFATIIGNVNVIAIHAQQQPFNNMLKLDFIQKFNSR
jgi:hypothetical protein